MSVSNSEQSITELRDGYWRRRPGKGDVRPTLSGSYAYIGSIYSRNIDCRRFRRPEERCKALMRVIAYLHILIVCSLFGYSTYSLFRGDFEQAFLPYPILILYYLLFARSKVKTTSSPKSQDGGI